MYKRPRASDLPPSDRAWFLTLGDTDAARARVVRELLRHAGEDRMSAADRVICRRVYHWAEDAGFADDNTP